MILTILFVAPLAAPAQNYFWSVGLRGGGITSGIDARVNFDPANSLHMMMGLAQGACFYGLYERNIPVIGRGFDFYYGCGLHLGSWGGWDNQKFTCGVDAIVGLEYKMKDDPIVFAADYKPTLNFTGNTGLKFYDFGLSMKYCF